MSKFPTPYNLQNQTETFSSVEIVRVLFYERNATNFGASSLDVYRSATVQID